MAREDSMNNESPGDLIMCVKVSLSKQSFGVWEKEYKDSHEAKTNVKTDNGKKSTICSGRHYIDWVIH